METLELAALSPYENFVYALKAKESKRQYPHRLDKFLSFYSVQLGTINLLDRSPSYGKKVASDVSGNPESTLVYTCSSKEAVNKFCLSYTINCPLCPTERQH